MKNNRTDNIIIINSKIKTTKHAFDNQKKDERLWGEREGDVLYVYFTNENGF